MDKIELFNRKISKSETPLFFEQYKLFVESAEKVSENRNSANEFFLALNTALITISGYLVSINQSNLIYSLLPAIGIIVNWYWSDIIKSYRQLNSKKFEIINNLELQLPINLFAYEWHLLGGGKTKDYKQLTQIEKCIPFVFIWLYLAIILILNFNLIYYFFRILIKLVLIFLTILAVYL
ncbi:MAG: hypothetical protein PHD05_07395 [Sphaerochaetaceae bacterium]|nr:hypothetical protein [Sphaerochaetaceae bacterium]